MIGNDSFYSVDEFVINGLSHLKSVKIGMNSFTRKKNNWENNPARSFHILNCEKLESINIDRFSFSDYSGEFELKNLPSLMSLNIGRLNSKSYNFYRSSFIVKGNQVF